MITKIDFKRCAASLVLWLMDTWIGGYTLGALLGGTIAFCVMNGW